MASGMHVSTRHISGEKIRGRIVPRPPLALCIINKHHLKRLKGLPPPPLLGFVLIHFPQNPLGVFTMVRLGAMQLRDISGAEAGRCHAGAHSAVRLHWVWRRRRTALQHLRIHRAVLC